MASLNLRHWAYRINLSYEGRAVKLQSARRLEMITPPSIHIDGAEKESGSWFTLINRQGRVLYRRPMGNPFGGTREMLGAIDQEFGQVNVTSTSGIIELLVPDLPEAVSLMIHASETAGEHAHGAARPVAQVSMTEVAALAKRQSPGNEIMGADHGRR